MKRETLNTTIGVIALISLGFTGIHHLSAQTPPPPGKPTTRVTTLVQADISGVEGKEIVVLNLEIPPGAGQPMHTHPGDEIAIVLEGEITRISTGEETRVIKAGESYRNVAGVPHTSENKGSASARSIAIFIVDKGKPRLVPVK